MSPLNRQASAQEVGEYRTYSYSQMSCSNQLDFLIMDHPRTIYIKNAQAQSFVCLCTAFVCIGVYRHTHVKQQFSCWLYKLKTWHIFLLNMIPCFFFFKVFLKDFKLFVNISVKTNFMSSHLPVIT